MSSAPERLNLLPRQPVLLTLAFTLLSLGLYVPIWFLRRRPALEALGVSPRLNLGVLRLVLALYTIDFILSLLSMLAPGLERSLSLLDPYAFWIDFACSLLLLWQSFRVKRMLEQAWGVKLDPLFTLFFQHLYLQNWMNHLSDRQRD